MSRSIGRERPFARFTIARFAVAALLLAALMPDGARSEPYPSRPVRLVLGFAPGTGSDVLGRGLTDRLSQQTGGTFLPDNRPGAGGRIATRHVIDSDPDGYTLTLGTNATLIVVPALSTPPPYDIAKDLTPVSMVGRASMVLVTGNTTAAPKSVPELLMRLGKGSQSFSSAGVGTMGHLAAELVLTTVGAKAVHVPYRGSSQSLTDVARGDVLFAVDTAAAVHPFVANGSLRPLAVTGDHRLGEIPNVPTFAEAGLGGAEISAWWGVLAPAHTPPQIVTQLGDDIATAMQSAEMATFLGPLDIEPFVLRGDAFAAFIRKESDRLGGFIQRSGLHLE